MIVAIDGPAGAGKSTVARMLAERLGFRYLDTGAMYRALTWLAMHEGLDLGDADKLGHARPRAPGRPRHVGTRLDCRRRRDDLDPHGADRQDGARRRTPSPVREVMREHQRRLAEQEDSVMEGRDIGKIVVPDADVKVYLVADAEVRAARRRAERPEVGSAALDTDLFKRDKQDAERMVAADDSVEIDTTDLQVEDVVDRIEALVRARQAA